MVMCNVNYTADTRYILLLRETKDNVECRTAFQARGTAGLQHTVAYSAGVLSNTY